MNTALNLLTLAGIYITLFSSIFYIYIFFENKKQSIVSEPKEWPTVTIAVPAYNDAETVGSTIESLLALDYPEDKLQIIAVENNCSTDGTYEAMLRYADKGVAVYTIPEGGKGRALNFSLTKATGEFFGGLDADSVVAQDSLKNLIRQFVSSEVMAVTPALKVLKPKSFLGKLQQIEYMMGVFLRQAFCYLDCVHVTPGPLTIYRKIFFDKHGGYDEQNITEDIEIAMRIQSKNFRIRNAMDANVYAANPETWKPLTHQRLRWYLGFIENVWKYRALLHPKYGLMGMFVLPIAFVLIFLALALTVFSIYGILFGAISNVVFLYTINFNFAAAFHSWLAHFLHQVPDAKAILAIPLVAMGLVMLYAAKYGSKEQESMGIAFILYLIAFIYVFSAWWMMAFWYKLFGREVKFGGAVWRGSIANKLLGRTCAK